MIMIFMIYQVQQQPQQTVKYLPNMSAPNFFSSACSSPPFYATICKRLRSEKPNRNCSFI